MSYSPSEVFPVVVWDGDDMLRSRCGVGNGKNLGFSGPGAYDSYMLPWLRIPTQISNSDPDLTLSWARALKGGYCHERVTLVTPVTPVTLVTSTPTPVTSRHIPFRPPSVFLSAHSDTPLPIHISSYLIPLFIVAPISNLQHRLPAMFPFMPLSDLRSQIYLLALYFPF